MSAQDTKPLINHMVTQTKDRIDEINASYVDKYIQGKSLYLKFIVTASAALVAMVSQFGASVDQETICKMAEIWLYVISIVTNLLLFIVIIYGSISVRFLATTYYKNSIKQYESGILSKLDKLKALVTSDEYDVQESLDAFADISRHSPSIDNLPYPYRLSSEICCSLFFLALGLIVLSEMIVRWPF